MRNVMQELDVPDWLERLVRFHPQTAKENQDKKEMTAAARNLGKKLLSRSSQNCHITCSGFVMNPSLDAVLMVYHNIYDSFSWTGGHADGSSDFLWTAFREIKEETGIQKPYPLTGEILSLDVLPVKSHQKQGVPVPAHLHYNVTYGFIASQKEKLCACPAENQAVQWIPVQQLTQVCKEPHMLPVYEKIIGRMQQAKAEQNKVMEAIAAPLLSWYPSHARALPWRQDNDPYHVWISEIMLQQTRVEAVKGYYSRFLNRFPNIQSLANAAQDDVNKCWEGLGYYSRAANLRKAAQTILEQHHGVFPQTWEEIRKLPGIGDYTAGAICSICFGLPTPAVDGNVLRVAARITDNFCEIDRQERKAEITQQLAEIYRPDNAGMLTQALMELGATVCLPVGQPHCTECPLVSLCLGKANDDVMRLPQRTAKRPRKQAQFTVFLLSCDNRYAIQKRQEKGLLQGLWEFPNVPGILTPEQAIAQAAAWGCKPTGLLRTAEKQHIFTHVEWELYGVYLDCKEMCDDFLWKTAEEIAEEYSLPTAFRQFDLPLFDTASPLENDR